MTRLRSLLYEVFLVGSAIGYSLAILALALLPGAARTQAKIARAWGYANLAALRVLCGLSYRVEGLEQFPTSPVVVLSKHQSTWETIALRAILPLDQSWVLKRELMRIPIFGWAMGCFQPIPIDRSAGRQAMRKMVRDGMQALDAGRWVIIFPEGTRVAAGDRHRYGIGGALLAEKAGRPVVPIAHNAGLFWARRGLEKKAGVIQVQVGAPIETVGRSAQEINAEVERWIEGRVARLPGGAEDPARVPQG